MSFSLSALGSHGLAELVVNRIRSESSRMMQLWIDDNRQVTLESVTKSWRRESEPPDEWLVGVYSKRARMREVREDIEARLDEILKAEGGV